MKRIPCHAKALARNTTLDPEHYSCRSRVRKRAWEAQAVLRCLQPCLPDRNCGIYAHLDIMKSRYD